MLVVLADEPSPLNKLSENHVMRYLQSLRWEFDTTLEYMRNAEKMREDFDCKILREDMFITELSWKAFVFNGCFDRDGRPLFFLRFGNFFPEAGTEK